MTNVINVDLYGGKGLFGGRETKKRAVVSSCEFADSCPALEAGRCAASNPYYQDCINLKISTHEGYTSRAAKYHSFVKTWREHEKYNAINNDLKRFEYIGEGTIRIELPHMDILKAVKGESGYDSLSANKIGYIKRNEFNLESLINLMNSYSINLMGSRLFSKKEKEEMLIAIKEVDKELYDAYIKETKTEINYKGKRALLKTLRENIDIGDEWFWNGETLSKETRDSVNCRATEGFTYGINISFTPEDDTVVKIKDNDWVVDTTKFKD